MAESRRGEADVFTVDPVRRRPLRVTRGQADDASPVSPRASTAISRALAGASVPDGAGLRLTAGPQSAHGTAVEISFVTAPEAADQVIETGAVADVFVAPAAIELLDDQVLDAAVGPDGAITFALYTQGLINGRSSQPGESAD